MATRIIDALDEALEQSGLEVDRTLLAAVIELQQRRQYDDDSERRLQEMESLLEEWFVSLEEPNNED